MALGFSLALVIVGVLLTAAKPAHAATTFTVNSTGDAEDVNPGDGACAVNDIPGSRAARLGRPSRKPTPQKGRTPSSSTSAARAG